jgi:hypothetical protein
VSAVKLLLSQLREKQSKAFRTTVLAEPFPGAVAQGPAQTGTSVFGDTLVGGQQVDSDGNASQALLADSEKSRR